MFLTVVPMSAVPTLLHLAYIPAGNQFFSISRHKLLLLIISVTVVMFSIYVAYDIQQRFEHLNKQVHSLRTNLRLVKSTQKRQKHRSSFSTREEILVRVKNSDHIGDGAGAAQLRAARDVLRALGPAVVTPSVIQEKFVLSKGGKKSKAAAKEAKNQKGEKNGRENTTKPHIPQGTVTIEAPSTPPINDIERDEGPSKEYPYLIKNVDMCTCIREELTYIITIHSPPENIQRRKTLRETWANSRVFSENNNRDDRAISAKVVFFLGASTNTSVQESVIKEFNTHRDIVQVGFLHSDCNATHKEVSALKWISEHCSNVKYVFKANDDTFVNVLLLMDILTNRDQSTNNQQSLLMCLIWDKMPVVRPSRGNRHKVESTKKCQVMDDRFSDRKYYPRYCSGAAYFLSGDIIPELYAASRHVPYFWVGDIYVTGLLTQHVKTPLKWVQEGRRYRYKMATFHEHYRTSQTICLMVSVVTSDDDMKISWALALRRATQRQKEMVGDTYQTLLKQAELFIENS